MRLRGPLAKHFWIRFFEVHTAARILWHVGAPLVALFFQRFPTGRPSFQFLIDRANPVLTVLNPRELPPVRHGYEQVTDTGYDDQHRSDGELRAPHDTLGEIDAVARLAIIKTRLSARCQGLLA